MAGWAFNTPFGQDSDNWWYSWLRRGSRNGCVFVFCLVQDRLRRGSLAAVRRQYALAQPIVVATAAACLISDSG